MKQTAVEFVEKQLDLGLSENGLKSVITKAKEIENQKQQRYNEMLEMLEELCNDTETWSHLFPSQQEKIEQLIKEATKIKNK
jgi:hypothetical protein